MKNIKSLFLLDSKILLILKKGLLFCFSVIILATIILFVYDFIVHSPFIYECGIAVFKLAISFISEFIICAYVIDYIQKQEGLF